MRLIPAALLTHCIKNVGFDTSCAGYRAGQRQAGFGRYGYGPCHPDIAVTGADDQRLHAADDRHHWDGATTGRYSGSYGHL
jgi:hypothetical protein